MIYHTERLALAWWMDQEEYLVLTPYPEWRREKLEPLRGENPPPLGGLLPSGDSVHCSSHSRVFGVQVHENDEIMLEVPVQRRSARRIMHQSVRHPRTPDRGHGHVDLPVQVHHTTQSYSVLCRGKATCGLEWAQLQSRASFDSKLDAQHGLDRTDWQEKAPIRHGNARPSQRNAPGEKRRARITNQSGRSSGHLALAIFHLQPRR
ncbi:hypothetical protein BO78DRAFT_195870 [Aspergillus sclerotiicarbonarius CBS 121057]|uniref:Uncharacterized protein n=1 Tax=Aspergillus sclerotiicarbonarius (strain CBS 121057 / IBT 28362) TaxID=1448318 RepID=A0A319E0B1_ASPSB|nr:hypothetical protein BO78DRAFT_195870 [Aspergillus sclerotiicarbonarius CBS 121057]